MDFGQSLNFATRYNNMSYSKLFDGQLPRTTCAAWVQGNCTHDPLQYCSIKSSRVTQVRPGRHTALDLGTLGCEMV